MRKNKLLWLLAAVSVLVLSAAAVMIVTVLRGDAGGTGAPDGSKPYNLYTWEEYQALSADEQEEFFQWFGSATAFEEWRNAATAEDEPNLEWKKLGKKPDKYTWEEYQALSNEEKEAFYRWFGSESAFEAWLAEAMAAGNTEPVPQWDKSGKKPDAYTWEEYQALSGEEQEAFYQWFGSVSAFEAWLSEVKPEETTQPLPEWNKPGKTPDQYTWEEYRALSGEEQEAFYRWFGSDSAFEAWLSEVKPEETTQPLPEWNKPGKTPDQYSWEEYQALSGEEQEAFYQWFGSVSAFEAWLSEVKPEETTRPLPEWNKPGKTPDQYTWEEYQALSGEEQEAFFRWFGSVEAFEEWMDMAQQA